MLIGELAEKAGTRPSTLRYYEERGLLPPAVRTASGYRSYDDGAVQRLQFIDRARAAGLTLAQIAKILDVRDAGGSPCAHVGTCLTASWSTSKSSSRGSIFCVPPSPGFERMRHRQLRRPAHPKRSADTSEPGRLRCLPSAARE